MLLSTYFLQLFKGEGIDDSVQVRRTQTCTHWLMIKPYINVRYDRLHRDRVWNDNDAAHQLPVASFNLPHTPEQPLRLGWWPWAILLFISGQRSTRHLPLSLWNTNQQWDALGAAICSHWNNHDCFKQPSRDQMAAFEDSSKVLIFWPIRCLKSISECVTKNLKINNLASWLFHTWDCSELFTQLWKQTCFTCWLQPFQLLCIFLFFITVSSHTVVRGLSVFWSGSLKRNK